MKHSENLDQLATALAAAQGEIENATKNANNPAFRSKYADLAEIINTVRPVLTKHGLAVVQIPGLRRDDWNEKAVATVETMLTHKSGQWISGTAAAPVVKSDPQGVGSAITYLRRYSLAALCAIAQTDDDGNAASQPQPRQRREDAPQRTNSASAAPWDTVLHFGSNKGKRLGELSEKDLSSLVEWIDGAEDRAAKFADLRNAALATVERNAEAV